TAEKDSGGIVQRGRCLLAVRVRAAADRKLTQVPDAQLTEHLLILGERLTRPAGRSRDHDDLRLAATAHPSEPLEHAVTAAPILGSADDQQAARNSPVVHLQTLVPDRGAAPDARSTRRYVASIRGYSLRRTPLVWRLRRPPA